MSTSTGSRRQATHQSLSPKRSSQRATWRHPDDRSIRVPLMTATVIALMEMGVTDYAVMAEATGLTPAEIKQIDLAEEDAVRQLGLVGTPAGMYFRLLTKVRCPRCDAKVTIAPCVACDVRHAPDAGDLDDADHAA